VTLADGNHLAHVIVLWQIQKITRYCTVFVLFHYFVFEGNFQVQAPGGLYSEERFNGGFFALLRGAYTWRGLFSEFYGIVLT